MERQLVAKPGTPEAKTNDYRPSSLSHEPHFPTRGILHSGKLLSNRPGLCPTKLQAKLAISQPGDPYEQEADRVADMVMKMPEPSAPPIEFSRIPVFPGRVQHKCSNSCKQNPGFDSSGSSADRILQLQRTAGNQAVQRLIQSGVLQAKLKIGQPNDIYEQEADRVAEQVMNMPEPIVRRQEEEEEKEEPIQTKPIAEQITPLVQRQSEEEKEELVQTKSLVPEVVPQLQRQPEEEEEEKGELLQTKEISGQNAEITPDLESRINAIRGGGQPLSESQRAFFEPRFGYDFSQVRVHTDGKAIEVSKMLQARAFTIENNIIFGEGQYEPSTIAGQYLMAHELAHTIQQSHDGPMLHRYVTCESGVQCPARTKGEVRRSRTTPMEVVINGTTGFIVANFGVGTSAVKADLSHNPTWTSIMHYMATNPNQHWEIFGFSDCQGSNTTNNRLRGQRADAINGALTAEARHQVDSVSVAVLRDCIRSNANEHDRSYNRSALILLKRTEVQFPEEQIRVPPPYPAPTVEDCRPWQSRMLTGHLNAARAWMNDAEPKVRAYQEGTASAEVAAVVRRALNDNFHTIRPADVAQIANGFASLRRELNNSLTFECEDSGCGAQAYVRGLFAWIRRLGDIHVCPPWFHCRDYFRRVTTIVHERAHQHPGATDHAYEWQPGYARLSPSNAINNAESYAVAARQIYHGAARGPGIPRC